MPEACTIAWRCSVWLRPSRSQYWDGNDAGPEGLVCDDIINHVLKHQELAELEEGQGTIEERPSDRLNSRGPSWHFSTTGGARYLAGVDKIFLTGQR